MTASSFNRYLSTLNVVLLFAGYQFFSGVLSLFIGNVDNSLLVNIGYRSFYAIVCLLVILKNYGARHYRYNRILLLLFLFWFFILLRFIDDMYFRSDVSVLPMIRYRTWLYMVALTIIPMVSVSLSIEKIDFNMAFKWITILISVAVLIVFFQNFNYATKEIEGMARTSSEGLSSIGTGQLGLTSIVLSSYYLLIGVKKRIISRIIMILVLILGFIVMLRTGSRGPLLAIVGVGSIYGISKTRKPLIWLPILVLFVLFYNQIFDLLLNAISYVAPNLSSRIIYKAETGGQFDNRSFYFVSAIEAFHESPIIGKQFAIYLPNNDMIYTHNIFMDSIMQLGIIGGLLMLIIISGTLRLVYRFIRQGNCIVWLCLLFVQELFFLMVSSSFYYTPLFSISIVLLFQWDAIEKRWQRFQSLKKVK